MAIDPISGALAGASLISGISGGKSAKKSANRAAGAQRDIAKRQLKIHETLFGAAEAADQGGAFDADAQIKQLEKDTGRYESEDLGGIAGAARVAGYQPGDTVVTKMLQNVKYKYRSVLDNARVALRRSSLFDKLGAYGMSAGPLTGAAGIQGNLYNQAMGSMPNAGGFFSSLMPFFSNKPNSGGGQLGAIGRNANGQTDIGNSSWLYAS
jgi:hypothetical protein